jgi:hypothetical protein
MARIQRQMTICAILSAAALGSACSGDSSNGSGTDGGGSDAMTDQGAQSDSAMPTPEGGDGSAMNNDSGTTKDAGSGDTGSSDAVSGDTGTGDSATADAADAGACSSWQQVPTVSPTLVPEDGGAMLVLHAQAGGTQNYSCIGSSTEAGTSYAWKFVGPEATLYDCNAAVIGHHFASEGGAAAPEWQANDGTYVIANGAAATVGDAGPVVKFDGGSTNVPWLLLQAIQTGGDAGTLSSVAYIQRLNTDGGVAPGTMCDPDASTSPQKVPYAADYYFYSR